MDDNRNDNPGFGYSCLLKHDFIYGDGDYDITKWNGDYDTTRSWDVVGIIYNNDNTISMISTLYWKKKNTHITTEYSKQKVWVKTGKTFWPTRITYISAILQLIVTNKRNNIE